MSPCGVAWRVAFSNKDTKMHQNEGALRTRGRGSVSQLSCLFSSPPAKKKGEVGRFSLPPSLQAAIKVVSYFTRNRKKKKKDATTYAGSSTRVSGPSSQVTLLNRLAKVHTRVEESSSVRRNYVCDTPAPDKKFCFASLLAATAAKPGSRLSAGCVFRGL